MMSPTTKRNLFRSLLTLHFIGLALAIGARFTDAVIERETGQAGLPILAFGRDLAGTVARSLAAPGFLTLVATGIALTLLRYGRRPPVWVLIKAALTLTAFVIVPPLVAPALIAARRWAHWSAEHDQLAPEFLASAAQASFWGNVVFALFLLNIPVAVWKPFVSVKWPRTPRPATVAVLSALALGAALLWAGPLRAASIDFTATSFTPQQLAPDFYVLTGSAGTDPGHPEAAGGRIGLLVGPEGVLMIDASYAPLADKVLAAIRRITPAPIRFLVDTHSHPDHTGGNPFFARQGAIILAREEAWHDLNQPPPPPVLAAIGDAASFTDPARLPIVTYGSGSALEIRLDGEIVDIVAAPAAHTAGDTIVRLEQADVIMIGDFYRNYGYPFVDAGHGGSFAGVLEALDLVERLAGPKTRLVPGHGAIVARDDIAAYRRMILDIEGKVREMIARGDTLQQVLAAKLTAPYDDRVQGSLDPLPAGLGTSADRFVGAVYAELKPKP